MRILKRYITNEFVVTFVITLVTVTFVMALMILFRVSDLLARGVPARPIAIILFSGLPTILTFSIPMSCMVASLLVFERLSGEGEITAMRACGVSIWQILRMPVIIGLLMTTICLALNMELSARGHKMRKETTYELGMESPDKLLEPGRFVRNFPGLTIRVGRKHEDRLYDIIIYDHSSGIGNHEIRAREGRVRTSEDGSLMTVELFGGVRVDPLQAGRKGVGFMSSLSFPIDVTALPKKQYRMKMPDYTAGQLVDMIDRIDPVEGSDADLAYRMSLQVELNQRIVLSLSCIAFIMLGIPFGIKTPRSTSSMGIGLSLLIVFTFYLFIILVNSLTSHPQLRPDLIIWIPVILSIGFGTYLLRKMQ